MEWLLRRSMYWWWVRSCGADRCGDAGTLRSGGAGGRAQAEALDTPPRDSRQYEVDGAPALVGLEDEIKAGGMPEVEWLALVTETLADADRGELATLGLPTKEQAAVLSPTAPLCAAASHGGGTAGSRALARGRGRLRPRGPAPRRGR